MSRFKVLSEDYQGAGLPVGQLPVKPEPRREGRPVVWVDLLDDGPLYYRGEPLETTPAALAEIAANCARLTREGYDPPHLAEHKRDGERLGDVREVRTWTRPGGRVTLIAAIEMADAEDAAKLEDGRIRYFSVGLGAVEDARTGVTIGPVVTEVSRVSAPHRKTREHVLGGEDTGAAMADKTKGSVVDPEQAAEAELMDNPSGGLEDRLTALEAQVTALAESLAKMMEPADEDDDDEDDAAELGEVNALKARIDALETEKREAEAQAWIAQNAGGVIRLSEARPDVVAALYAAAPDAFKALCESAGDVEDETPATPDGPDVRLGSLLGLRLGESTAAPPDAEAAPLNKAALLARFGGKRTAEYYKILNDAALSGRPIQ